MRVLIVEDEAAIADFVRRGLEAEGYEVRVAADGVEGERLALEGSADLVILDRMLPRKDGMDVLSAIRRADPALPVILLTARGEVSDRVEGLDRGATDYLAKPFAFEELAARVRAHLRRPEAGQPTRLEGAGVELDLIRRTARRDGEPVHLSAREFDLLAYLMSRPGEVVPRERILSAVWGYDHDPGTNVVQVYVGYLRRRLGVAGADVPIETVRSVGYRFIAR
ncbi:MAG: response regulator transcription factor [Solirubrobacterales bacterium]